MGAHEWRFTNNVFQRVLKINRASSRLHAAFFVFLAAPAWAGVVAPYLEFRRDNIAGIQRLTFKPRKEP